nr:MAG TPA: hypothetical protein [Caudoviricetes sp.]
MSNHGHQAMENGRNRWRDRRLRRIQECFQL